MKRDEFASRYIIKIITSVFIILLNSMITIIIPRAFSLEEYGYYTFNINIFTSIVGLANLSTSNALNAKYAKRNNDIGLLKFYGIFFCVIALVLNISLLIAYPFQLVKSFFGSQTFIVIILGLETAILNKLLTDVISVYDSIAVTRFPAVMQSVMKILMSCFVLLTYLLGVLNIVTFYIGQAVVFIIIIVILCFEFFKDFYQTNDIIKDNGIKSYIQEFYFFCKPLVIVTITAQLLNIYMDSILMKNSGPEIRAIYGAASQLNALLIFVFSPYAELSKREFAIKTDNTAELESYFMRSIKMVMWGTAFFAVFIAVFSDWIVPILFGEKYITARMSVIIIMIYTIFQAWGQVISSFLLSLERTKESAWLTVLTQVLLFIGTFLFLKPNFIFPSGLGAEGMALTRTVANVGYVLMMIVVVAKRFNYSLLKMNLIYMESIAFFSLISIGIHLLFTKFNNLLVSPLLWVIISGIIYTVLTALLLYNYPHLIGFTKERIRKLVFRK